MGTAFVVVDPHKLLLGDIGGGEPKAITELQSGESVVRWSGDGRYLFLAQAEGETVKLTRVEVASRKREPWRVLKVPESGAEFVGQVATLCRWQGRRRYLPARSVQSVPGEGAEVERA